MLQVRPLMELLVERVGVDRLIWGTDMPIVMRFYTYRQCIEQIKRCCDFLNTEDLDMILGGNAARILDWQTSHM